MQRILSPDQRATGVADPSLATGDVSTQVVYDLPRILIASVQDYAIFALSPTGHITTWNPGAERLKGYTAAEAIGRHFSMFYPQEDLAAGKPERELETVLREGRFEEEGWRVRKDGSLFWANVVITAIRAADGKVLGFAKVTRDLTERRAAQEKALRDARELAESRAASRARREFLAVMSHELRTPLNAIGGYTELLALGLRGPVTATQLHDLERIRQSQHQLLALVNDLLNINRLDSASVTYDIAIVRIGDCTDSALRVLAGLARERGLVHGTSGCAGDVCILADRAKVEQILLNLVSNAVKFTPPGGEVSVSCSASRMSAAISVSNAGEPIPPDKLERIFEPFVQLGRTLSRPVQGSGLGLSISREIARAMGGDLTVESGAGGSTFTLSLPRADCSGA